MVDLKFQTITPKNHLNPQNTHGYSVTYLSQSNSLLLFGVLANCDLYLFSLTKQQWQIVKTSGKKPSFRRCYAHYYHNELNALIIHGGQIIQKKKKIKSSDECYILFIQNWQWRKIFLPQNPPPRQLHQFFTPFLTQNNDKLFFFGGFSKPYDFFLNDLWSIRNVSNISTNTSKHEVHGCDSALIPTKGKAPSIFGYATKVIDSRVMFVGGEGPKEKRFLQINMLCLKNFIWQRVDIVNKVCPSLFCLAIYQSGLDDSKLYIMGGIIELTEKANQKCYSLNLQKLEITQQTKSQLPQKIIHSCCITQTPLCISGIQLNLQLQQQLLEIHIMYEKSPSTTKKYFQTDEIEQSPDHVSIEDYLKAIKHEQILSQELIKKNLVLEELYKEIQSYIAALYSKYLLDEHSSQPIENQKLKNIRSCEKLKHTYLQNAFQFQNILKNIKKLRAQLGLIHQDFQKCIETEMDEDDN